MKLIEYHNLRSFFLKIFPVIENNFISHYLFYLATDRLMRGKEEIYYGCTIQTNNVVDIIYMHTKQRHYFFGMSENKQAVDLLSNSLLSEHFNGDSTLFGSTFIIDNFIENRKFNYKNIKYRYYMSLKSYSLDKEKIFGDLHLAQEKDYDLLAPLELAFYKEEFEGNGVQEEEDVLRQLKNAIELQFVYYWTFEDQITTLISVSKLPGNIIYIPSIYTKPDFRCKGISKSALGKLIFDFFNSGTLEIGLNVKVSNRSAIRLFKSLGMNIIYETGIYQAN